VLLQRLRTLTAQGEQLRAERYRLYDDLLLAECAGAAMISPAAKHEAERRTLQHAEDLRRIQVALEALLAELDGGVESGVDSHD
jgi:hypothetical protein